MPDTGLIPARYRPDPGRQRGQNAIIPSQTHRPTAVPRPAPQAAVAKAAAPTTASPGAAALRARDRAATEERILGAVGAVLASDGFGAIGVNAIARAAGVDKVLIYRYFGGLPELLRAWGSSGRFWPRVADLLGPEPAAFLALPEHERYTRFFAHFIDELRARPLTLEVMAAEIQERNELTAILESEREAWGEEASRVLAGAAFDRVPHARGLTLLLIAGVQHLLLRARRIRIFGGLDIRQDEAWAALKADIAAMARQMFAAESKRL